MGEAKVTLRIDVSEALESIRKVREGAKNVTSGGGRGRGGKSEYELWWERAIKKREAAERALAATINKLERDHGKAIVENSNRQKKSASDYKRWWDNVLKSRERLQSKIDKDHSAALKFQQAQQAKVDRDHAAALRWEKNERAKIDRAHSAELRRLTRQQAIVDRDHSRALRDQNRLYEQRIARISRAGSAGLFNSTFQAGLTRLGGMGGGPVGGVLRNAVTGGFFGQSIGASAGTLFRGAGRNLGTSMGGVGGQLIGGLGAVLGTVAPVVGALKGAQIGATFTIAQAGFSAAVNVFSSAARMLAGVVSSIAGTGFRTARNLAVAGTAGAIGVTGAGIRAYGQRVGAETGLNVVGGAYAPSLMGYGNQLANAPGQMFSRTSILQGITKASAFGMSPGLIRYFMPKMMNAAAVFGEDTAEGMRALARAAFQAEPEAAERFGLNLYERNIRQMTGNKYNLNDPNQKAMAAFETAAMQLRKFQGGMQAQRRTPGGAFQYVKNQGTNLLEQIGMGFSQGFQLIPRLNQLGGMMGAGGTKGTAFGIASGVGSLLGRGADFLSRNLPGRADLGAFFSSRDEGTRWSAFGDIAKGGISAISSGFQTIIQMANQLYEKLAGDNGLFKKMREQWNQFSSDWVKGMKTQVIPAIVEAMDKIHETIGKAFKGIVNEAMGGVPGAAKKALTSREFITGLIGAGVGGVGGFVAAGPPVAVAGAMGGFGAGVSAANASRMFFDKGGVVDAPEGAPVPAIVHGGEMILNRSQQKMMGIRSYAAGTIDWGNIRDFIRNADPVDYVRKEYRKHIEKPLDKIGGFFNWSKSWRMNPDAERLEAIRSGGSRIVGAEIPEAMDAYQAKTTSGAMTGAALNYGVDKLSELLLNNKDKVNKLVEFEALTSSTFKENMKRTKPKVDSAFDKIARVFSASSRANAAAQFVTPSMEPVGVNWAYGRNRKSMRRGRVLSRLGEGAMAPGIGMPGLGNMSLSRAEDYLDAMGPGGGAGYNTGRLSRNMNGIVINHYGNTYRRGDSNDLMRLAEAV